MAKVLLIQPPIQMKEYAARGSSHTLSILPPMGLAYIAAYLRSKGHRCEIIDGFAQPMSLAGIAKKAAAFDVVGITTVSTLAMRANQLATYLKKKKVKAPIVMGGAHATVLPQDCLDNGADYVIIGEGEMAMLKLVEALESGRKISGLKGVAFKKGEKVVITPRVPLIQNLDMLPMPARDLLPMRLYRNSEARSKKQPSYSLFTSRGCNGACTFCTKALFGAKVRYFSVDRIVEEFFELRDRYGAADVAVWDDNFVSNHEVVHAVCDKLIQKKFNRTWSVEARVDSVDLDLLKHMKAAGCDFIAYGLESGSQKVLDRMNKRIKLEQSQAAIRMTKEAGINIRGYFMMGLPGETIEEMEETIEFAKRLDIDVVSFTLFVPLPGTVDYIKACKSGHFRDKEYYKHGVYPEFNFPKDPLYVPEGVTAEELLRMHRRAYNSYYFRPKFLFKSIASIRSLEDTTRLIKGGLNLISNAFS